MSSLGTCCTLVQEKAQLLLFPQLTLARTSQALVCQAQFKVLLDGHLVRMNDSSSSSSMHMVGGFVKT